MNVAVVGASNNPSRYSYMAIKQLLKLGHNVFCVHPKLKEVQGLTVFSSLGEIRDSIHTITLYISTEKSSEIAEAILKINPKRIIFNPGAENIKLMEIAAKHKGIDSFEACTLVLLSTAQF